MLKLAPARVHARAGCKSSSSQATWELGMSDPPVPPLTTAGLGQLQTSVTSFSVFSIPLKSAELRVAAWKTQNIP